MNVDPSRLMDIAPGTHVAWVVSDPAGYRAIELALIAGGKRWNEKVVTFGPQRGDAREGEEVPAPIDPRIAVLGGGALEPALMFATFREMAASARAEGFAGLRVIADMDWLLPSEPTADHIVAFELLLDRVVSELGATVVCAYRTASFAAGTLLGTLSVHPAVSGAESPPFRIVADGPSGWHLSGEVDCAVERPFTAAIRAATQAGPCEIDVSALGFIDIAGMRALAHAGRSGEVSLRGAAPSLQRIWRMCGFEELAPLDGGHGEPARH